MQYGRTSERSREGKRGGWPAEGATARPLGLAASRAVRRSFRGRGFTLTELLIVIGLIVLIMALAVPAFRAMTGGRSVDAAFNQLSAVFGQARNEAIGLQEKRGVMFYIDPASGRVNCALVRDAGSPPPPPATQPPVPAEVYLDLVPERDPLALPVGVGLQVVDNADVNDNGTPTDPSDDTRRDDGYLGYNPNLITTSTGIRYGGVILFDEYGRLVNKRFGFMIGKRDPTAPPNAPPVVTAIGELILGLKPGDNVPGGRYALVPRQQMPGVAQEHLRPPRSQLGFVLYDAETFRNLDFTDGDPQLGDPNVGNYAGSGSREAKEEQWLDQNATPVLVNRYNGTLMRGE